MNLLLTTIPIIIYALILLGIILRVRASARSDEAYFLADRGIGWFQATISVVATETSVATIMIFPAIGMKNSYTLVWLCIGYILGRWLVTLFYLRKIYTNHKLSIYETVTDGRSASHRALGLSYLLAKFISSGVRYFLAGYALHQLFGLSIPAWILIVAAVVGLYSLLGGMRSVVLTDFFQFFIILIVGILLCYLLGAEGNWGSIGPIAWANRDAAYSNALFWPALLIGGTLIMIGSHCADQDIIQRVLATHDFKSARRSLLASGFCASIVILLYLTVGVLLQPHASELDPKSPLVGYITTKGPLIISSFTVLVLAAAMSSLDSTIHSTGAVWKAIFNSQRTGRIWSGLSLMVLVLFGIGFIWLERFFPTFLGLAMGSMNYMNGGLIGVFTIYVFFPRYIRFAGIIASLFCGFATTYVLTWFVVPAMAWSWTIVFSSAAATFMCVVGSLIQSSIERCRSASAVSTMEEQYD